MHRISCEICMDLIPLVQDGIANEHSRKAVEHHIQHCENCRAAFQNGAVSEVSSERSLRSAIKRVRAVSLLVLTGFILMGIYLCESVMQGSSMVFVLVVLGIYGLFLVAFRKEEGKVSKMKRIAAFAVAVALTVGTVWAFNELFGNPVAKARAEAHIQGYLEGAFPDTDYYIEKVLYNWSGGYDGFVHSATDPGLEFYIAYRDGMILYDTYENHVLDIWE